MRELGLFQGLYALDFKKFWIAAHSLHDISFIIAIAFNWRLPSRRKVLLIIFAVHIGLRTWTILYFAPALIAFQQIPVGDVPDELLRQKST